MAKLGFNARLFDIKQGIERGDVAPLLSYLRSGDSDPVVQGWLADAIDPMGPNGYRLIVKGPDHRPAGGKALDRSIEIAEALDALKSDRSDQRRESDQVEEIASRFKVSVSKVRKDYASWKKVGDV